MQIQVGFRRELPKDNLETSKGFLALNRRALVNCVIFVWEIELHHDELIVAFSAVGNVLARNKNVFVG
jgi:hypothetical protein